MKRRDFIKKAGVISGAIVVAPLIITSAFAETKPLVASSSLDRVNVSRMVTYIKQKTGDILQNYIFEPNDVLTRSAIQSNIDAMLADLISRRGIQDYMVVCDESNNSPTRVDAGDVYVDLAVKLNRTVEYVYIPARMRSQRWNAPAGFNRGYRGNGDHVTEFSPYVPL